MRRAAKVDANHVAIVAAFRAAGAVVLSLASLGKGVPDLLVSKGRWCRLVEVKTAKGKLTDDQVAFWFKWKGPEIHTVRSEAEAVALVETLDKTT